MEGGGFGAKIYYVYHGFEITETMVVSVAITVLVAIFSILVTRKLKKAPGKGQTLLEIFVTTIYDLTANTMGQDKISFAPFVGALCVFLALANLSGLVGVRSPTADLNTTLGLALMTFFMTQYNGIKSKGFFSYLKGLTEPLWPLTPINIIGELSNPISLSFRLFGNVVGGLIIMSLLYGALSYATSSLTGLSIPFLQVGIPAVLHMYFDIFSGLLQTFIFAMLSMVFISGAME